MAQSAFNYDSMATVNSGCRFVRPCDDSSALNYGAFEGCTFAPTQGCMDDTAINFDSRATLSSGCAYPTVGCMDSNALNFSPAATVAGPCQGGSRGCTINGASNFDSDATVYDASCIFLAQGCTDSTVS